MKQILFSVIVLSALSGAAMAQDALPQQDSAWFKAAEAALQEKITRTPNTKRAKNIILMISDGNGVGTNYATRLFQGQKNGGYGDEHVLPQEAFPYLALVKTYNTNAQTPDSAGTSTAMHSGVKTKEGVIGVDETLNRGDCAAVEGASVTSVAEILAEAGKSVGVVSTARITHATPAGAYAHSADRNFEDDSKLPEGCTVPDIAVQLIDKMKAGIVDVAMGGGRRHFLPKGSKGEEGKGGKRKDGRDLIEEAKAFGAQYAWNDETAGGLTFGNNAPILGLFHASHMMYEHDRSGEPSLAQMTEIAIKALQGNDNGFFLHVEAGRVDHANHAGNLHRAVTDGVAFAEAVAKADELTDDADTLIIVTADHEHAIAFNGYCGRGSPITGLCHDVDSTGTRHLDTPVTGRDGKPYTVAGYLNGPGSVLTKQADGSYFGTRPIVKQEEAVDPDYVQQALIPRSSDTHSGEDVAVYAKGPWAHLFAGTIEQNVIFHVMLHAANAE